MSKNDKFGVLSVDFSLKDLFMTTMVREEASVIDGSYNMKKQYFDDGSVTELIFCDDKLQSGKNVGADGSFRAWKIVKDVEVTTEELLPDGTHRWYDADTQKIKRQQQNGTTTLYYENGQIESVIDDEGMGVSYHENGNLHCREEKDYLLSLDVNGNIEYEYKNGRLTINPEFFSYYHLGMKISEAAAANASFEYYDADAEYVKQTHWIEKITLNPRKKTLLCLGGDQSKDARSANGNIMPFARVLGFSEADMAEMQLVSCYRPSNWHVGYLRRRYLGEENKIENDMRREILQKFMPFMAREFDGKFERLSPNELLENFGNIIIQAHCYGSNDLPVFAKVLQNTMQKLGYDKQLQKKALRQILCVTNNTQRELTDKLDFSIIHRYSVKDGQFEPEYETQHSDGYPVFVQDHARFKDSKRQKASFIQIRPNELLMVFSKVMKAGNEHNEGFWTTEAESLTTVGQQQAALMKLIGKFWLHHHGQMPNIVDLVRHCVQNTELEDFAQTALASGRELKRQKMSALDNPHILDSARNRFTDKKLEPEKSGIYKLLSEKYRT